MTTLTNDTIDALIRGEQDDPFAALGSHVVQNGRKGTVVVRAFLPGAARVTVIPTGTRVRPQGRHT